MSTNRKDHEIYERRWGQSFGTSDENILELDRPKSQVSFFYLNYNKMITNILMDTFGDLKDLRMLEVGCGRGTASIYQAIVNELQVTPVDFSKKAVAIASKNLNRYNLPDNAVQADIFSLPFEPRSFDVVLSLGVMEHIEETVKAYRCMQNMLCDGGIMLSMNVPEKPENIQKIAVPINKLFKKISKWGSKTDNKPWLDEESRSKTANVYRTNKTSGDFANMVSDAGFTEVEIVEVNPFPTFDPLPLLGELFIVKLYELILLFRRKCFRMPEPFISNEANSRTHFIVGRKAL